jgi:dethiobiotin synthetase
MGKVYFITGIDTNIGKTYATGMLSKALLKAGKNVITQKIVQTGCTGLSEDLVLHREIEERPFLTEDKLGWTAPYIFAYPCSPHMAAEMENHPIDPKALRRTTDELVSRYDYVLVEGAGGLMVPLTREYLTIDYIKDNDYPIILVTSGRLGSLNHTLLSIFACKQYGIKIKAIVYNMFPHPDESISDNSLDYLKEYMVKESPETAFIILPEAKKGEITNISELF